MQVSAAALFWLPVAFLYFQSEFGIDGALRLAAIYYLAVVLAEVPSGWFSDRLGRVVTIRLAAVWWIVANALFLIGERFVVVAAAQVFLALGFAFLSGTVAAFHYDSLEALGRSDDFEAAEARVARDAMVSAMVASVVGGGLGVVDLRLPFGASLVGAVVLLVVSLGLVEPEHDRRATAFGPQVVACLRYLRRPLLAWLLVYVIAQLTLEHLAFDLTQPYLAAVLGEAVDELERTPALSGVVLAVVSGFGAVAAASSPSLRARFGLTGALNVLALVQATIVVSMALVVSWAVVPLLAMRSIQTAAAPVLVVTAVSGIVAQHHRATYLSIGSLAGRLGYGAVLIGLSSLAELDEVLDWSAGVAAALFAATLVTAPLAREAPERGFDHSGRGVGGRRRRSR